MIRILHIDFRDARIKDLLMAIVFVHLLFSVKLTLSNSCYQVTSIIR